MRPVDRAACGILLGLAVLGPSLVRLAGRTLEPTASTFVAWLEGDGGRFHGDGPPPAASPVALDPWGRPFYWRWETMTFMREDGACEAVDSHLAASAGPSADDPADDIVVDTASFHGRPSSWRLLTTWAPALALLLIVWLAVAWRWLRRARRARPSLEAARILAASAPATGVAWLVVHSERGAQLGPSLPQLVPNHWAITLTIVGLALIVVLAVRLLSRPPEPA